MRKNLIEFAHIVLLLPTLEKFQQRTVSCPPRAVALGPLPLVKLGLHSNWLLAELVAYVTPGLQFLTRRN